MSKVRAGGVLIPLFCTLVLLLVRCRAAYAQVSVSSEDILRASLVQHLTLFVEWPGWKMDATHPTFNVCLLGSDPIGPALADAFRDKAVLQKAVVINHLQSADKVADCHLLYIGTSARRGLQRSLPVLEQAAVLTVSERTETNNAEQVIGLPRDESHIRIEVNLKRASESKLAISSRLLRLATITETP